MSKTKPHERRLTGRHAGKTFAFIFCTILALIWLVPIIMMLVVSIMPPDQRAPRFGGLLISGVSLRNYVIVFEDAEIIKHFINSAAVTIPSVVLVVLISSLAAFALARLKFLARDIWFYLLIMTLMLPIPTLVVPIFQINKALGLNDNYLGLILPYTALGVPFAIVILRSFFANFPIEIEEAARLDGCTRFGIYWRIMMPLTKPVAAVLATFTFFGTWNSFFEPLVFLQSTEQFTVTIGLATFRQEEGTIWNLLMAASVITLLPSLIIFMFTQRYFVRGIVTTGLK